MVPPEKPSKTNSILCKRSSLTERAKTPIKDNKLTIKTERRE